MQRIEKALERLAPFVLFLYLFVGMLAYVNIWPGSASFFYSSSVSGVLLRMATTFLLCGYSVFIYIIKRKKNRLSIFWLCLLSFVLICNLLVMLFSNHDYCYFYTSQLYGRLHEIAYVTGYKTLITMYLSSVSDFALAFCFMFLLPSAFKDKKQLLILTIPMIVFMTFECGYSLLTEYVEYKGIFSGQTEIYGGYNISIGATFGDKQEFGCFLTVAFCCAIVSFVCADCLGKRLLIRSARVLFFICALLFFVICFFTLCKTAIIANCLGLACVIISLLLFAFKKNRPLFFLVSGLLLLFAAFITAILTIRPLHETGFFAKVYQLINTLFLSRVNNGILSRFYLVDRFFSRLTPIEFIFGFSKGGVSGYMRQVTVEGQANLHTGFVYFQACYGIVGTIVYFLLLFIVIRNLYQLVKKDKYLGLAVLGCFVSSLIFNLSECEVLIVSGSAAIFMFNVICVTFTKGYIAHEV